MAETRPTERWFTEPHLYLGVVTLARTRTRSPTLMQVVLLWIRILRLFQQDPDPGGSGKNHFGSPQLLIRNKFEVKTTLKTDEILQFLKQMLS
jgi:hypothetical protein